MLVTRKYAEDETFTLVKCFLQRTCSGLNCKEVGKAELCFILAVVIVLPPLLVYFLAWLHAEIQILVPDALARRKGTVEAVLVVAAVELLQSSLLRVPGVK